MEITKEEKYIIYAIKTDTLDQELSSQIEKSVAVSYSSAGMINYIVDLASVKTVEDAGVNLFQKIQKIVSNEGGLLTLVSTDDDLLDGISQRIEGFVLMLPTVEEAVDAVFMNELENEFKDEEENEFGTEGEAEY